MCDGAGWEGSFHGRLKIYSVCIEEGKAPDHYCATEDEDHFWLIAEEFYLNIILYLGPDGREVTGYAQSTKCTWGPGSGHDQSEGGAWDQVAYLSGFHSKTVEVTPYDCCADWETMSNDYAFTCVGIEGGTSDVTTWGDCGA
jgi:hypothetical protein